MDTLTLIAIFIGIWIFYSTIAFIVRTIGQKIRDTAAKKVFSKTSIDFKKDEREIDKKMSKVGCSDCKDIAWVKGQPLLNHGFKRCPQCKNGILIKRVGKYGTFMGCTNYPYCTYISKPYESQQEREKDIISKMREAYK